MNDKSVTKERHRWTKAERQYVQGIIHNYSLQRWTDQDIVNFLWQEKKIKIGRSTVTTIKNRAEKEAEKWYISLRESSAKYIAIYKDRLDSLSSYQRKLHELINIRGDSNPELVLRAISELHRIELSLHTLMKELPGDIKTSQDVQKEEKKRLTFDVGADNLQHYLDGTGSTKIMPIAWLRSFTDVTNAEKVNQARFQASLIASGVSCLLEMGEKKLIKNYNKHI